MPGYAKRAVRVAVRKITNSEAYLTQIAAGGQRFDLHGNPRGEISEDAKKEALERLAAKRAGKAGTK